jgi:hypothetical protein
MFAISVLCLFSVSVHISVLKVNVATSVVL